MQRTFKILEDFVFLAIFVLVTALVTVAVYTGDDAYPLASATTVVTSAQDRATLGPELETAPAPTPQYLVAAPAETRRVATTAPMTSTGDAAPSN